MTESYTGTATVELGEPPEGATGIEMKLTALTPGCFEFPDGASASYTEIDADARLNSTGYTIPLAQDQHSVTITTEPGSR